jgi:hypothetical protein
MARLQVKVADPVDSIGEEGRFIKTTEQILETPVTLADLVDRWKRDRIAH